MECYACENEATRQCRRCARVYCELHGGDLCAECMSPASALPSFNVYRGSLLALLVGTAVALWLIVRPPGSGDTRGVVITQFTPTPIVAGVSTPTPDGDETLALRATATPEAPTPALTPTVEQRTYIVQEGDTLLGIAEQFAPPGADPFIYAQEIAAASGLSSAEDAISPGQTLVLP
jgi:hypothetical protein